ncbi:MAG: hypothetical protein EOO06_00095 [Chitinophagaceae bacterium]|nr:MAG: hypothetical protein EOO06_00095 [Chitinophagaceae bacterium]
MKQQVRELLVTTKVAQQWHDEFDQKVDELMTIVSKVDTEPKLMQSAELLDVYHNNTQKAQKRRKKKMVQNERPFEFLVFCN